MTQFLEASIRRCPHCEIPVTPAVHQVWKMCAWHWQWWKEEREKSEKKP